MYYFNFLTILRNMGIRFVLILKLAIILQVIVCVEGYPTIKRADEDKPVEQVLPNGTVIGKYAYVDKEGNPIQVKYYADDQSYGVELNKLKIVQSPIDMMPSTSTEEQESNENKDEKPLKSELSKTERDRELFDLLESMKYPPVGNEKLYKISEPLDYLNKVTSKPHQKNKYAGPAYEVYLQNNLNAKQCASNNKVRVYNFDKGPRKDRDINIDDVDDSKFCEQ